MTAENADQGRAPVAHAAERILAAVELPVVVEGARRALLVKTLADHLHATREASPGPEPVTQKEAFEIEQALARLRGLIEGLRDRANPPPMPGADSARGNGRSTALDHWLTPYRFPDLPGRPARHDWAWIARVLAIYEIAFGRPAAASSVNATHTKPQPAMRFLSAAFAEGDGTQGEPPPADTLRSYLGRSGRTQIARIRQQLNQTLDTLA